MKDNLIHFYEKNDEKFRKWLWDKHQAWFHEKSYRKMAGKDYDPMAHLLIAKCGSDDTNDTI